MILNSHQDCLLFSTDHSAQKQSESLYMLLYNKTITNKYSHQLNTFVFWVKGTVSVKAVFKLRGTVPVVLRLSRCPTFDSSKILEMLLVSETPKTNLILQQHHNQ